MPTANPKAAMHEGLYLNLEQLRYDLNAHRSTPCHGLRGSVPLPQRIIPLTHAGLLPSFSTAARPRDAGWPASLLAVVTAIAPPAVVATCCPGYPGRLYDALLRSARGTLSLSSHTPRSPP